MNPAMLMHGDRWQGQDLTAWIATEKHDGFRALWDRAQLWTRAAENYHAPAWFTAGLPEMVLDCELFAGYGRRSTMAGIHEAADPERWRGLKLVVFDAPEAAGGYLDRLDAIPADLGPFATKIVPHVLGGTAYGWAWAKTIRERGGEGIVCHDWRKPYRAGRQTYVVKLKVEVE